MANRSLTIRMADEYAFDAHALVWFLEGNPLLGPNARAAIQDPASVLFLPMIALAEACWVVEHGKSSIPSVPDLLADVDADPRIIAVPLDRSILDLSLTLSVLSEMHDRQIVATVLHLTSLGGTISLITRDAEITASGLIPIIW
jgi:PIN domain nuclease of toxin-antitoxin system